MFAVMWKGRHGPGASGVDHVSIASRFPTYLVLTDWLIKDCLAVDAPACHRRRAEQR
jgi:hypothetical protein